MFVVALLKSIRQTILNIDILICGKEKNENKKARFVCVIKMTIKTLIRSAFCIAADRWSWHWLFSTSTTVVYNEFTNKTCIFQQVLKDKTEWRKEKGKKEKRKKGKREWDVFFVLLPHRKSYATYMSITKA